MSKAPDLNDLHLYDENPRRISSEQQQALANSITDFGDLSGIIRNVQPDAKSCGQVFGGNQRLKIIQQHPAECQVVITEWVDPPNESGTIAYGYIEYRGERFSYREVTWSDERVQEACVKANLLGGEWDFEVLENCFEVPDLVEWGFEPWQFKVHAPEMDLNEFDEGGSAVERDREGAPAVGEGGRSKLRMPGFARLEFHVKLETRDRLLSTLNSIKDEHGGTLESAILRLVDTYNEEDSRG